MIYILFIVSIFSYVFAPESYSYLFCSFELGLFIISVSFFLKKIIIGGNLVNFHVFFIISYFFVNYVYPIFIYPIDPEYFFMFSFEFNHNNIPRGLALCQVAIVSYMIGVLRYRKNEAKTQKSYNSFINIRLLTFLKFLLIVVTLYFIYIVYSQSNSQDVEAMIDHITVSIYMSILGIYLLLNCEFYKTNIFQNFKSFISHNTLIIISILLVSYFSLWYGDRGPVIQIGLMTLFVYSIYVNKIALRVIILLVAVGFVVMTFVSSTRGSENNLRNSNFSKTFTEGIDAFSTFTSLWDYGMDFIINSRSTYVAFEIVQENGFLYGKSYVPYLFVPVPGLPVLVTELLFNTSPEELSTARIISNKEGIYDWGLGTNSVGDIYMNFGVPGVITLFLFFGFFIRWVELGESLYLKIAYLTTMSLAVYYPRASLLTSFDIVRTIIILWILFKLFNKNKFKNENIIY